MKRLIKAITTRLSGRDYISLLIAKNNMLRTKLVVAMQALERIEDLSTQNVPPYVHDPKWARSIARDALLEIRREELE